MRSQKRLLLLLILTILTASCLIEPPIIPKIRSLTSQATHTPAPSNTPHPTYTQYPTYTPFPESTENPKEHCNPSWRDPDDLNFNIASSAEEARNILKNELKRATRVSYFPGPDNRQIHLYITYLSPQVIEAIVLDKAAREGFSKDESKKLIMEFDRRLQTKNAIPFLLTVRGDPEDSIKLGALENRIVLVNQRHKEISPISEYTSALSEPINMAGGGIEGYVLFPRNIGEDCIPSVDLVNDHSFDIRLRKVSGKDCYSNLWIGTGCNKHEDVSLLWPYTLLPDIPLDKALDIPLPQRASADIDLSIMLDILGLALSVFEIIL